MGKTRKNRKNPKKRNKRSNIKIKGKPRILKNYIEFDIEFIQKHMKKSRKINGGGDFTLDNCDFTQLIRPITIESIPKIADFNLDVLRMSKLEIGSNNNVKHVKCKHNEPSGAPSIVLRILTYPIRIENDKFTFYKDLTDNKDIISEINSSIIHEYNIQIHLSLLNLAPSIFSVFLLKLERALMSDISISGSTRDNRNVQEYLNTVPDSDNSYVLCCIMERVTPLQEKDGGKVTSLKYFRDVRAAIEELSSKNFVHLDCKPDNMAIYAKTGKLIFIDFDPSFVCRQSTLPLNEYMNESDIVAFCSDLMMYIFTYYVINFMRPGVAIESIKSTVIDPIITKTFIFDKRDTPFLEIVAKIYLSQTDYRITKLLFPVNIWLFEIFNAYVLKERIPNSPYHDFVTIVSSLNPDFNRRIISR